MGGALTAGAALFALLVQTTAGQLTVTTTSCPGGTQLRPYAGCMLEATGGKPPYAYSVLVGQEGFKAGTATLPEGLSIVGTKIVGDPIGGQGFYRPTIVVTDATGATATTTDITFSVAGNNTLGGCELFPPDSIFHTRVDKLPVDTSPAAAIPATFLSAQVHPFFGGGPGGGNLPNGIPFVRVPSFTRNVSVSTALYQHDFSSAPYPPFVPVEGSANAGWEGTGGDRHALVVQEATGGPGSTCKLFEMWFAERKDPKTSAVWTDGSNAAWPNLQSNQLRPNGVGSCDACGLPITPLLANYDETCGPGGPGVGCVPGEIRHPIRFTLQHTLPYWVWPGRASAGVGKCTAADGSAINGGQQIAQGGGSGQAGRGDAWPVPAACSFNGEPFGSPCGQIYRLRANVSDPPNCADECSVLVTAFRNYGVIVADNGASGGLIGTPDARWNGAALAAVRGLTLADFEPVDVSSLVVDNDSGQAKQSGGSGSGGPHGSKKTQLSAAS